MIRRRLGEQSNLATLAYGEPVAFGPVTVSLHPAGHLLGSAQVRLACGGETWVVSGDYKTEPDRTCAPFEAVECDVFITESTFGLPVYRWPDERRVFDRINAWWRVNRDHGWTSVLYVYALGKAQRALSGLDDSIGPILLHGAVAAMTEAYREAGVALPAARRATESLAKANRGQAMVIAPLSTNGSSWLQKFNPVSTAFASGWMAVRGARRRRSVDRGFVLSDHADWPGLHAAIHATGARRIGVTHGFVDSFVRWLGERGYEAFAMPTRYEGELEAG